MKKKRFVAMLGALLSVQGMGLSAVCGQAAASKTEPVIFDIELDSQEGVGDFLTLYEQQGEKGCSYGEHRFYNVAPPEIAETYDFGMFKCDACCETFLVYEDELYRLGTGFGGWGLMSCAVADLDGNGSRELYYTYSSGSGIHRTEVGYFDLGTKTSTKFNAVLWDEDMMLMTSDGKLQLTYPSSEGPYAFPEGFYAFPDKDQFPPGTPLGEIVYNGQQTRLVPAEGSPIVRILQPGDADGNGRVDLLDVVILQKWLVCGGELEYADALDLCEDGVIDTFDLAMLKRMIF